MADTIYGLGGADIIHGARGNDLIRGGTGADSIDGDAGMDTIYGDAGGDQIFSAFDGDADTVRCGTGSDDVTAGYGDRVFGQAGNDAIWGGGWTATGGAGRDTFSTGNIAIIDDGVQIELYGKSTITDFVRGEDKCGVVGFERVDTNVLTALVGLDHNETFNAFDTNDDGRIALGDDGVSIVGQSIKIDFRETNSPFADGAFNDVGEDGFVFGSGEQSLTVVGIQAILSTDWLTF